MLTLLSVGAATAALLTASDAAAKPLPPGKAACADPMVCVGVQVPGAPGHQAQKPGAPSRSKGGKKPSVPGPCVVTKMSPQPPASSSVWEGHDPAEGAIYTRTCPSMAAAGNLLGGLAGAPQTFWAAQAPVVTVDPAQLAREAVDKMTLRGAEIGITPKPGGKGVVGMPVWMWTAKGAETYGPNSASASAGGVTVTATAKVSRIVWKMGDGATVTCTSAGTPYKRAYGKKDSPDCGHRYERPSSTEPSGKYHVAATSTWSIDWQVTGGGGETGELTEIRDSDVDITVAEVQVLN